jgi:transposase
MVAGRPTKYDPEAVKAIIGAIELGLPYRHAAAYGGITDDTFAAWRKKYPEFSEAVKAAEARAVAGRLARIRRAEDESWQAAAWYLERRYPQEFGRTVQDVNHGGQPDNPVPIVIVRKATE